MAICEQSGEDAVSGQMVGSGGGGKNSAEEGGTNLARERDQMMFAQAGYVDVANKNHLVMILRKDSAVDHVCVEKDFSVFNVWGCKDGKNWG